VSTLALEGGGVDGKRHSPASLLPGKNPGTNCTGGYVGPKARSGREKRRGNLVQTQGFEPRTVKPVERIECCGSNLNIAVPHTKQWTAMFSPKFLVFSYLMVLCRTCVYICIQTVCGLLDCDTVPFGRYIRTFSAEHAGYILRVE